MWPKNGGKLWHTPIPVGPVMHKAASVPGAHLGHWYRKKKMLASVCLGFGLSSIVQSFGVDQTDRGVSAVHYLQAFHYFTTPLKTTNLSIEEKCPGVSTLHRNYFIIPSTCV